MPEITQVGADGRRRPVEVEEPANAEGGIAAENYEDPLVRGAGKLDPATQIGPDGKRVPADEIEREDADNRHVPGSKIDVGTQITADGSRKPRDEVDPDAPAPRFADSDLEAPKPVEDAAEVADAQTAEARDTVQPEFGGGEYEAPESAEVVTPEPGQLGGEELGNESMPVSPSSTPVPAVGTSAGPGEDLEAVDGAQSDGVPNKSAPKGDWVDYAVEHGGLTHAQADAKTKDELIEEFGS